MTAGDLNPPELAEAINARGFMGAALRRAAVTLSSPGALPFIVSFPITAPR